MPIGQPRPVVSPPAKSELYQPARSTQGFIRLPHPTSTFQTQTYVHHTCHGAIHKSSISRNLDIPACASAILPADPTDTPSKLRLVHTCPVRTQDDRPTAQDVGPARASAQEEGQPDVRLPRRQIGFECLLTAVHSDPSGAEVKEVRGALPLPLSAGP